MTIDRTVAVIGGSGHLGAALAGRWAKAGINVVIGSRDQAAADQSSSSDAVFASDARANRLPGAIQQLTQQ